MKKILFPLILLTLLAGGENGNASTNDDIGGCTAKAQKVIAGAIKRTPAEVRLLDRATLGDGAVVLYVGIFEVKSVGIFKAQMSAEGCEGIKVELLDL